MPLGFFREVRSPKRWSGLKNFESDTLKELNKIMDTQVKAALIYSHERIVRNWKTQIGFSAKKVYGRLRNRKGIHVYVWPTGPNKMIWYYVDLGTDPHWMPPVTGKLMVFRAGGEYVPKTMAAPARTVMGGGYVTGGDKVFATRRKGFTHPGSDSRGFSKKIATDLQPHFRRWIENAFRRSARRANRM